MPGKPVGTVWLGWATPEQIVTELQMFAGDRAAVRLATVRHALIRLAAMLAVPTGSDHIDAMLVKNLN